MISDPLAPSTPHAKLRRVVEALNHRTVDDFTFADPGRAKQAAHTDARMNLRWFPGRRRNVWFSHRIATPAGIMFYRLETT